MPGRVHAKLSGVNAVADSDNQQTCEANPYTKRVQGALGAGLVAILEQKHEATEQAGDDTKKQQPDNDFDAHAC